MGLGIVLTSGLLLTVLASWQLVDAVDGEYQVWIDNPRRRFENYDDLQNWLQLSIEKFQPVFEAMLWFLRYKAFPPHMEENEYEIRKRTLSNYVYKFGGRRVGHQCSSLTTIYISQNGEFVVPQYHAKCKIYLEDHSAPVNVSESDILRDEGQDYAFKAYFHCLLHLLREVYGDEAIEDLKQEKMHSKKDWLTAIHDRANYIRKIHGVPPLQLDEKLSKEAQEFTDEMASRCEPNHANRTARNICYRLDQNEMIFPYECIDQWYKEIQFYPYPEGYDRSPSQNWMNPKRFAQMVWKGTKLVGYGHANCGRSGYVTAFYYPSGNIPGEYNDNVFAPGGIKAPNEEVLKLTELERLKDKQSEEARLVQFGLWKTSIVWEIICWFEYFRIFPSNTTNDFIRCHNSNEMMKKEFSPLQKNATAMISTAQIRIGEKMSNFPEAYNSSCGKWLADPWELPETDESRGINDNYKFDNMYAFKAFGYCLVQTTRTLYGDKVVDILRNQRTVVFTKINIRLLDLINKIRARHGAEPLKLHDELTKSAQEFARLLALECRAFHSDSANRDLRGNSKLKEMFNLDPSLDRKPGENLYFADDSYADADIANFIANSWLNEGKLYPFPTGFEGTEKDPLFQQIGNFTQIVWKDSKYVGFGYSKSKTNGKCRGGRNNYVVVRFYPMGNIIGKFKENVGLPEPDPENP